MEQASQQTVLFVTFYYRLISAGSFPWHIPEVMISFDGIICLSNYLNVCINCFHMLPMLLAQFRESQQTELWIN